MKISVTGGIRNADSIQIPVGTTATRPTVPVVGDFRWNTDLDTFEVFTDPSWEASSLTTLSLADGTAAAPSLRFTLDDDTGIYRVGDNSLGIVAGGVNVATFNSTGLVGNAVLDDAQTFTAGQRGEITTLTDGVNISINFNDSNNFTVTLGGNRTLSNPTNVTAGQSGIIVVNQDGTGGRTLAFGSNYNFINGVVPSLTTGANAIDVLSYFAVSTTVILVSATFDWS